MADVAEVRRQRIPLGRFGLFGIENEDELPLGALVDTDNMTFETGAVRKIRGATKFTPSPLAAGIIGGYSFRPDATNTSDVVVLSNGEVLLDNDADGDYADGTAIGNVLASGLTVSGTAPFFVTGGKEAAAGNRKLFLFTGKNAVQVLSGTGTTMAALATPPADWAGGNQPLVGLIHEERLWGAGNLNAPHTFYYSTAGDHEDFTGVGSGFIAVYPGEHDGIIGAASFAGFIVVFKKPSGVYLVDTRDPDDANWKPRRLSGVDGATGPHGVIPIDNDILFMTLTGDWHRVSQLSIDTFSVPSVVREAGIDEWLRNNANLTQIERTRGIYYYAKRQIIMTLPKTSSLINDAQLTLDTNLRETSRFHWGTRDVAEAIWLRKDTDNVERPVIGDDVGDVYKLDQAVSDKDGNAYPFLIQTAETDLSVVDPDLGAVNKNGRFLELAFGVEGLFSLDVDVIWDGRLGETVRFEQAGVFGFVLDTDRLGTGILGPSRKTSVIRRRIGGSGRAFSLRMYNTQLTGTVIIYRLTLGYTIGSEELR